MVIFGISTAAAPVRAYWKNWLNNIDFKALEINLFKSDFPFSQSAILKNVKPTTDNFDVSLHSRSNPLFENNKILDTANRHTLLAEIEIANLLRIKHLVFHLPKVENISIIRDKILEFLPKVIELAESKNVQLLLENNSSAAFSRPEDLLFVFDNFSELQLAIDTGHVFKAEKEGADRFDFLNKLGKYATYAHVHDSETVGDKHQALFHTPRNEEFFKILKKCDIKKYIMESHTYDECIQTRELLKKYGFHEGNDV